MTDKLETYSHEEVDAAEAQLCTSFPDGYREYVTTLGKGEYCGYINVSSPQMIVKNQTGDKPPLLEFCNSWGGLEFGITPERLAEAILIATSIDGDWVVFEAGIPDAVYILPESEDLVCKAGVNLRDALDRTCQLGSRTKFRYFDSKISQKEELLPSPLRLSLDHFRDWITATGEYDHLDLHWNDNPGVSLEMYRLLEGRMDLVAPELGEVTAFYKSFGGYVMASAMSSSGAWAQLVHDAGKDTALMQKISEYLRSKAA